MTPAELNAYVEEAERIRREAVAASRAALIRWLRRCVLRGLRLSPTSRDEAHLMALPDHLLRDIGIERQGIRAAVRGVRPHAQNGSATVIALPLHACPDPEHQRWRRRRAA